MTSFWRAKLVPPSTSWRVLEQAQYDQAEAWSTIARIYSPLVYAWTRRMGLTDSDASDITQEVFLKVYLKLNTYSRELGRFRCWLWTVTRNAVIEHGRKSKSFPSLIGQSQLEARPIAPDEMPIEAESEKLPNEVLMRSLEIIRTRFKEQTFQAAWRTLALGLAPADVAHGLQMSTAAVYVAKSRVLKELRLLLGGLEF